MFYANHMMDKDLWLTEGKVFMNYLDDSTESEFIETDPNNPKGTRDTEKGKELFNEIENILNESE